MKQTIKSPKSFLSICVGIAMVMCSLALFVFNLKPTYAEVPTNPMPTYTQAPSGTDENYIPLSVSNGYAYWMIYNTTDGYKFRKSPVSGQHWVLKTK